MTPHLVPAPNMEGVSRRRGRAATAAGSVQGRRPRTGTNRAVSTANTAPIGRRSRDFQHGSSSTAGAATPARSPAGGQRPAVTASHAAPEGAAASRGSAAASEAVSGTAARLEGAPVRGSEQSRMEASDRKVCRNSQFFFLVPSLAFNSNTANVISLIFMPTLISSHN